MALDIAAINRKKGDGSPMFTRVSKDFIDEFHAETVNRLTEKIHRHPSRGSTLKGRK